MNRSIQNDELSLRELFQAISRYKVYLFSKWKVIILAGIICAILGLGYSLISRKVYKAELTFAIEEGGGGGSYALLASQFGMDMGGGSDGGAFSGDNIIELMKSRLLIENTLLTPVTINGTRDLLINRYIEFNNLRSKWEQNPFLATLKYTIDQPRSQFSIAQDSILNAVHERIKRKELSVEKVEKQLSIVNVEVTSKDELFAKYFTEILAKNVSAFYIETKTRKSRANVTLLQSRLDSVKKVLDAEMYTVAVSQDRNQNQIFYEARIPLAKRQMNIQILTTMYGELTKNLELSKFTLMKEEPLIQVIDTPILPLKFTRPGKLISIVLGGLIGCLGCVFFLIAKRAYSTIMKSSKE